MLDVMRNPPPVTVQVTWHASRVRMPDTARTVQIYCPEQATEDDTGVCEGYYDPDADEWCSVEGYPLGRSQVTWWAEKTQAPAEPGAELRQPLTLAGS